MTERNCGNCRHFVRINGAATGHCTNPLVVSHQGQLVMYRAAEIGCRRGWKQDLWEAGEELDTPVAADAPTDPAPIDYGRAAAWADSAPSRPDSLNELLESQTLHDDDLIDPRRVRNSREAMRRAREMKKREQMTASSREPFDQPILGHEQVPGEDSVLHVQPAPAADRAFEPIVPPVSADEVRKRVDEMRQPRHYNDPPPSIHFDRYDEHFTARSDEPILLEPSRDSRFGAPAEASRPESDSVSVDAAYTPTELDGVVPYEEDEFQETDETFFAAGNTYDPVTDYGEGEDVAWPEQAPWSDDEPYDHWQQEQPRRRSWFGNLFHRQPRQRPLDPREAAFTWEPELDEVDDLEAPQPIAAGADDYAAIEDAYVEATAPFEQPGVDRLPPLPYGSEADERDDYLLADGRFADGEEEDVAAQQIEHVCATCRYFRPDGTCGNAFAFTYRRRVSEEYLSCASSIGTWWLPSDYYWESVVSFTHHGQPTPLLDRYEIQAREADTDDEVRTP